ncbi:MAG: hypothetical protein M0P91_04485 [Sulfuricurvum sp.]|jgi:hypothetical protein|uniref:hypothetical protein n=1 Tax=Sulfuricurvum sp. TaxID=2025608 RepID=UPI0025CE5A0F|nr:hypothetical protein [Sulfuricurvum sp.]MCK9372432.1 hypothetical protein [Sulfuricurvum sp.]
MKYIKDKIDKTNTFFDDYNFLIFGGLGIVCSIVFFATFENPKDFFTREALAAESLILTIIFLSVLVNLLLKKKETSTDETSTFQTDEENYFQRQSVPQPQNFVPKNELDNFAVKATATTATAIAAVEIAREIKEYEWEEVEEVKASAPELQEEPKGKTFADGIDILKTQVMQKEIVEEMEEEDFEEDTDEFEIDYTRGFVPQGDKTPFDKE